MNTYKVSWNFKGQDKIFISDDSNETILKYIEIKELQQAIQNLKGNKITNLKFEWNDYECPIENLIQIYEDDELEKIRLYNEN